MKLLTNNQKKEILSGIECEGLDYYFLYYTGKWAETESEIQEIVKNYVEAAKKLEAIISEWEDEFGDDLREDEED